MTRKILRIVYYAFLTMVVLITFFLIFSAIPLKVKGGCKTFVILSGSMEPKVKTGSVAVVQPAAEYKVGDIITFGEVSRTKTPTTHRIYDIKNENGQKFFITKGDANNAPDQKTITEKEILGKVLFSVPYAGYAVAKAKTPIGFLLIVIVPSVVIIYEEVQNIVTEVKKIWTRRKEIASLPEEMISNFSFDGSDRRKEQKNIQPIQEPVIPAMKKSRKLYH